MGFTPACMTALELAVWRLAANDPVSAGSRPHGRGFDRAGLGVQSRTRPQS
jgi:hypothetical protein